MCARGATGTANILPLREKQLRSGGGEVMDERIPHFQDRHFMEHADFLG